MAREYTHVQELLPSILAMKGKGYTYRQIADQWGLKKEQVEELCKRERKKNEKLLTGMFRSLKANREKGLLLKKICRKKELPNLR